MFRARRRGCAAGVTQSAVILKSLDLWPVFRPKRGSSTPQQQPINRRQFSTRVRGLSQRLMSPLHVRFTTFCSIGLISFLPPALLCYLPHLCSSSTLSAFVFYCLGKFVCERFTHSSAQVFPKQADFPRTI